jgi:integrase
MPKLSPSTLTRADQHALLETVQDCPREALLVSLALGTGLRLAELVGLDLRDVYLLGGHPRVRIRLRAEVAKRGRVGDVFLPDAFIPKLERFWEFKVTCGESLLPGAPLFCSRTGRRLSKRRVQVLFRELQLAAGLDRLYPFHVLSHTAITTCIGLRGTCSSRRGSLGMRVL